MMTIESSIEQLELRVAPAVITSPTPGVVETPQETAEDPTLRPDDGSAASPAVMQPESGLTNNDLNDLTDLQDLTTVTDLTDVSRAVANLGLAPNPALGTAEAGGLLNNVNSPILRDTPATSISPDSVIAVLGLDRVETTVFPGTIELLGGNGSAVLFDTPALGLLPVGR